MSKIIDEIIEKYIDTETPLGRRYICAEDVYQIIKEVLKEVEVKENDAKEIGILNTTNLDRVGGFNQAREIQSQKTKELFEEVKE